MTTRSWAWQDRALLLLSGLVEAAPSWPISSTKAFAALTPELRAMVEAAAALAAKDLTAKYLAYNPAALKKLLSERVQLRAFPRELMDAGFKAVMATMAEHEAKSAQFKKFRSMRGFQHDQLLWDRFSEFRYASYMSAVRL
jgi:TRAP-type mannitol/chloroaromatic compound transport system substrate-binding protein